MALPVMTDTDFFTDEEKSPTLATVPSSEASPYLKIALLKSAADFFSQQYRQAWADYAHLAPGESMKVTYEGKPCAKVTLTSPGEPHISLTDARAFARACRQVGITPPLTQEATALVYNIDELRDACEEAGIDLDDYMEVRVDTSLKKEVDSTFLATYFDDVPEGIKVGEVKPRRLVTFDKKAKDVFAPQLEAACASLTKAVEAL